MSTVHACIDCVHHINPDNSSMSLETHSLCGHEFKLNLVSGRRTYKYCDLSREYGPCFAEARFFEPKSDPRMQERDDNDGEPIDPARPF
jgi:hypothetical protein